MAVWLQAKVRGRGLVLQSSVYTCCVCDTKVPLQWQYAAYNAKISVMPYVLLLDSGFVFG